MDLTTTRVQRVLTRSSGYLRDVCSHSLQPYRGCSYGASLCGVGCYVQHNPWVGQGRRWGSFLEARENASQSYLKHVGRERGWARKHRGAFSIFMSSATDPFVPQEQRLGITASIIDAMADEPPDLLIVQTHSHLVAHAQQGLLNLSRKAAVRVQLSIETDRDHIPGLPRPASTVASRLSALAALKAAGLETVVCVAPLLPIERPEVFFERIAASAHAVIVDHFIGGDGSLAGSRTQKTPLPRVMAELEPGSDRLDYRDHIVELAREIMPGRVGVSRNGFAGRFE